MPNFDPYHKWLAIPPQEQPPNHYRLLGVQLFESDPDVIASAADQRMAHIRSFQTGTHADLSQQILNELAAARVCLLNPEKKAEYDQALPNTLAPPPPAPVAPLMEPPVVEMDFAPVIYKKHKKATPSWMPWAVVGVGGLVAVVLLGLVASQGGNEKEVANAPATVKVESVSPSPPVESKKVQSPPKPAPQPEEKSTPEVKEQKLVVPKTPVPPPMKADEPAKTDDPPKVGPKPEIKAKLPIPDAAAQEKSLAAVRGVYADDYKKPDKAALAKKLLQRAQETQDATDRFVLLREAERLATEDCQGDLAFDAIDAIAADYDLSGLHRTGLQIKAGVLEQVAKRPHLTPEQKSAIVGMAFRAMDDAFAADEFDVAKEAGRLASQFSRLLKEKDLAQEATAKCKQLAVAEKAYADAEDAMATLKEKPDDPEANLIVGKYECFSKADWDKGLPLLAKGSDEKLKSLAAKDIAGTDSSAEGVKLGDAWWNISKERADYWYDMALPGLVGLEKDKVIKRIPKQHPVNIRIDGYRQSSTEGFCRDYAGQGWLAPVGEQWGVINKPLTSEALYDTDILVVLHPASVPNARKTYTTAECDAVVRFVEKGGGLLIVAKTWPGVAFDHYSEANYPPNLIGVRFGLYMLDGEIPIKTAVKCARHPITTDFERFKWEKNCPIEVSKKAIRLIYDGENHVFCAVAEYGKGRVCMIDQYFIPKNYRQLLSKVFHWLVPRHAVMVSKPVTTRGMFIATNETVAPAGASKKPSSTQRPDYRVARLRPQNNLTIGVVDALDEKLAIQFPPSQNRAKDGKLQVSSTGGGLPQRVFDGERTGDAWNLHGAKGSFVAMWDRPPQGQYILLFGKTTPKGTDAWGNAMISVNGGRPTPIRGMSGSMVTIIDLGHIVPIKSVAVVMEGGNWNPGLCGIEIHESMQEAKTGQP